jgi:2-amino-4-hydroxy-6-hydroxymethyldihydropteridine diphosphokinase
MNLYLGLGANIGDRQNNILRAIDLINEMVGSVTEKSSFHETVPWGFDSDNTYLNAALEVQTSLTPGEVLSKTQEIESLIGRKNKTSDGNYEDRPIDIDILIFGSIILNSPGLIIPHPLMHKRLFVLDPFAEIAPQAVHPVLKMTIEEIRRNLTMNDER